MIVVCERCRTEYEFEEALLSPRGTAVKCSQCGNQFRVVPPVVAVNPSGSWELRREDGTTVPFDSLAVLQRWIADGRALPTDQLSRDGTNWKRLGAITELDTFFARSSRASDLPPGSSALDEARPPSAPPKSTLFDAGRFNALAESNAGTQPMPSVPRPPRPHATAMAGSMPSYQPTLRPPAMPAASSREPSLPVTLQYAATMIAAPIAVPLPQANESPDASTQAFGLEKSTRPGTLPPPPLVPSLGPYSREVIDLPPDPPSSTATATAWEGTPSVSPQMPSPVAASEPPAASYPTVSTAARTVPPPGYDSMFPPPVAPPRSRLAPALGVIALVIAAAAGGWYAGHETTPVPTVAAAPAQVANDPGPSITSALQLAHTLRATSVDEARDALTALLGARSDDARVLAARAEVLATGAESERLRASDLLTRATLLPGESASELRGEANAVRREADKLAERARHDLAAAESAAVGIPAGPARHAFALSAGSAARALGDASSAARNLASAKLSGDDAETRLLDALVARDAGRRDEARMRLTAAADAPETSVRARFALARMLAADGDRAGAMTALAPLLSASPPDEDAVALRDALGGTNAMAVVADAAVAVAPVAPAPVAAPPPGPVVVAAPVAPAPVPAATPTATPSPRASSASSGESSGSFSGRDYDSLVSEGERAREHGQRDRARGAFTAALASRPDGSEANAGLGFLELSAGDASAAVAHFRRVLDANPRYSEAWFGMGTAYRRMGNTALALHAFQQYLEINPNGSRASAAQGQVDELDRSHPAATAPEQP